MLGDCHASRVQASEFGFEFSVQPNVEAPVRHR